MAPPGVRPHQRSAIPSGLTQTTLAFRWAAAATPGHGLAKVCPDAGCPATVAAGHLGWRVLGELAADRLRGLEVEAILVLGVARSGTVNSRSQAADQLPDLPISGRDDLHDGLLREDVPGAQRPRLVVGGRAAGAA